MNHDSIGFCGIFWLLSAATAINIASPKLIVVAIFVLSQNAPLRSKSYHLEDF